MSRHRRLGLSLILLAAIGGHSPAVALPAPRAAPQFTFNVNSPADLIDNNLADNQCLAANGFCTLRAAVMQANASAGTDTINVAPGTYLLSIPAIATDTLGLSGDLDLISTLTLNGDPNGQTVIDGSGGANDRVFDVFTGTVTLSDLTIQKGVGAGLRNQLGATLTLERVTVVNNSGTGLRNDTASLTLNNSAVISNGTSSGLYLTGAAGVVALNNVTLSGNTSAVNGGGIYIDNGAVTLNNVTLTNNSANNGSGGGLYRGASGSVTMQNSILAGNVADTGPDCSGPLGFVSYSLVQTPTACAITGFFNLLGVAPLLGPLQNNGGPTLSHALAAPSPALNAGNPGGCLDHQSNLLLVDQRGTTRPQPQGGACDLGAFELPAVQFASATFSAPENAPSAIVTATLDGLSAFTVTVPYTTSNGSAIAGSDYLTTTGTLTLPPNVGTMTLTVPLLDDLLDENDETLLVTLGQSESAWRDAPLTTTLTLVDDDLPPTVQFSASGYSATETSGLALITATLSAPSALTATVAYSTSNGTAQAGSDYTARSGTLTFTSGLTVATWSVPILNDNFYEASETVSLALGGAVNATLGAPPTGTLTIFSDDPPRLFLPVMLKNYFACLAGPNEIEPNGSVAQANGPLCAGRGYVGGYSTPGTFDWDYYAWSWPQAGTFTVTVTGPLGGSNVQVQMYYQTVGTGSLVGYTTTGPTFQITCPVGNGNCTGAAGVYYILIYLPPNYPGPNYTLTVTTP